LWLFPGSSGAFWKGVGQATEPGELRFLAPYAWFRSRERKSRLLLLRSHFLDPFGRASAKNSYQSGVETLLNRTLTKPPPSRPPSARAHAPSKSGFPEIPYTLAVAKVWSRSIC
jgi:hypothetical protein